jgi:hypothetical protein
MPRIRAMTLLAAVVTLAVLSSGCTLLKNPVDDANVAIAEANVHFKAYEASNDKFAKLNTDLGSIEITPGTAPSALEISAQMTAELTLQKTELEAGIKAMEKVKTFDVDATFKKYADLEIAAVQAKIAVVDEMVKLQAEKDRMYTAFRDDKAAELLTSGVLGNIETIQVRVLELDAAVIKAMKAADAAFTATSKVE